MARSTMINKRALSPVIATVILVSVTIVVAASVAYWMGGITSIHTRFEKVKVSSCYAVKEANGNYTVSMIMKNSGSEDATISCVLINGKRLDQYGDNATCTIPLQGLHIAVGQSEKLAISIVAGTFGAGTTLDIKLHSAAGKDYPWMLSLP